MEELQEAMKLPTLLSALALILALMQGVLALESTHPARISLRKGRIMLGLELLELGIVFISEILTFHDLSAKLRKSVKWLQWLAPALLCLGILELFIDGFATLRAVSLSRALWVPISSLSASEGVPLALEFFCFTTTTALTVALVGWRQALWWRSTFVFSEVAIDAANKEGILSTPVLAACTCFALVAVALPALLYVGSFVRAVRAVDRSYHDHRTAYWTMSKPQVFWRDSATEVDDRMRNQYRRLCNIQSEDGGYLSDSEVDPKLNHAPLHLGNTLLGDDSKSTRRRDLVSKVRTQHFVVTALKQVAMMPLLFVAVLALFRMRNRMDRGIYEFFEEFADALSVIVLQELAMALKALIWKLRGAKLAVDEPDSSKRPEEEIDVLVYKKL